MRTAGRFPAPMILCDKAHVDLGREQVGTSGARLVVEPEPRHSATAIVDGDDILVMPLARSQDVRAAARAHQ